MNRGVRPKTFYSKKNVFEVLLDPLGVLGEGDQGTSDRWSGLGEMYLRIGEHEKRFASSMAGKMFECCISNIWRKEMFHFQCMTVGAFFSTFLKSKDLFTKYYTL